MKTAVVSVIALLLVLTVPLAAAAQAPELEKKAPVLKYDPAKELKLKGTVEGVKEVPAVFGKEAGVVLSLRTDGKLIDVQVAPVSFLKDIGIEIKVGERVELVVCKHSLESGEVALAREIQRDQGVLVVRDPKGGPVWTWAKN